MSKFSFKLTPWDGKPAYACLPLVKNVPAPRPGWEKTKCVKCGEPCWMTPEAKKGIDSGVFTRTCTVCALKAGLNR